MHCMVAHMSAACLLAQAGAPLLEQLQDLGWERGQRQAFPSLEDRQTQHKGDFACLSSLLVQHVRLHLAEPIFVFLAQQQVFIVTLFKGNEEASAAA